MTEKTHRGYSITLRCTTGTPSAGLWFASFQLEKTGTQWATASSKEEALRAAADKIDQWLLDHVE